jgi:ribosomal protein S18 acetylase RimI-like enzyme
LSSTGLARRAQAFLVTALQIRQARAPEARRQASWIAGLEPWRGLGYRADRLGRWLAARASDGWVRVAVPAGRRRPARPSSTAASVSGIIVVQPHVLLGSFIALLAVPPSQAGQGIGRALVEDAAVRVFAASRWLYTSSDGDNRAAARFYRAIGFERVGRLPDLVAPGRVELLWRMGRPVTSRS